MKSCNRAGSVSSDVAAKHRRLVGSALDSENVAMMLCACRAKGIDIGACAFEGCPVDRSILEATSSACVVIFHILVYLVRKSVVGVW